MDDGVSNPVTGALIFVALVLLDFVVFGFFAAMQNLNEAEIERLAQEKNRPAELLKRYLDKSERYVRLCELLTLMAHMLLGVSQVPLWHGVFLGLAARVKDGVSAALSAVLLVVAFIALMLIVLVVGIYTPQIIASRRPYAWAMRLARPVRAVEIVFSPAIWLLDALSGLLARLFGVDPFSETDDVTEEEIISMVNEGHEQGVLLASEAEMIHNIFAFGDKDAKDIMTHRSGLVALDGTKTYLEAMAFLKENRHSRFPVYLGDLDNIIGVLHIREALDFSLDESYHNWQIKDIPGMIRDVDFIPETRGIDLLFKEMQAKKSHMVIVVDEYGQTAGVVAMEDILEEIVGNIEDEHDDEEREIERMADGSLLVHGMAPYGDLVEALGIGETGEEFDTANGFLISLIGKVPGDGEVFSTTAYGYLFEILSVEGRMVRTVRVTKIPEDEGGGGGEGAPAKA